MRIIWDARNEETRRRATPQVERVETLDGNFGQCTGSAIKIKNKNTNSPNQKPSLSTAGPCHWPALRAGGRLSSPSNWPLLVPVWCRTLPPDGYIFPPSRVASSASGEQTRAAVQHSSAANMAQLPPTSSSSQLDTLGGRRVGLVWLEWSGGSSRSN